MIGSLLLLLAASLGGQSSREKLRLIHSDKLSLVKAQDEQVMQLTGKVHFWYGPTEFKSDRALIFDTQKIARLDGNVKVSNDSLSITADSLVFYRLTDELKVGGGVEISEFNSEGTKRWFRSENAVYNRKDDNVTVWREVSSYDKEENASLTCGYAFWDRKNGYSYLIENPVLETAREDTLLVSADKIEYFSEEKKVVATFNVLARTQDYQATSDFLLYWLDEEKAVFTGEPAFSSEFAEASAREFYLFLDERKLSRAELVDSCLVVFGEQPRADDANWVRADFIKLEFRDETIDRFQAENAVSYHYTQDETEERDFFINHAKGDYLEASFKADSKLDKMKMLKGIKGVYRFHNKS